MSLCQEIAGLLTPISPHTQHRNTVDLIQTHLFFFFLLSVCLLHGSAASLLSHKTDSDAIFFKYIYIRPV